MLCCIRRAMPQQGFADTISRYDLSEEYFTAASTVLLVAYAVPTCAPASLPNARGMPTTSSLRSRVAAAPRRLLHTRGMCPGICSWLQHCPCAHRFRELLSNRCRRAAHRLQVKSTRAAGQLNGSLEKRKFSSILAGASHPEVIFAKSPSRRIRRKKGAR